MLRGSYLVIVGLSIECIINGYCESVPSTKAFAGVQCKYRVFSLVCKYPIRARTVRGSRKKGFRAQKTEPCAPQAFKNSLRAAGFYLERESPSYMPRHA